MSAVGGRAATAFARGGVGPRTAVMVAIGLSAVATGVVWLLLSTSLSVRTDIVGNPIYRNFDITLYGERYWLLALGFPLLALALFLVLARGSRPAAAPAAERAERADSSAIAAPWQAARRIALPAGVVGAEIAVLGGPDERSLLASGLPAALAYAFAVVGGSAIARTLWPERPRLDLLAAANALLAPLAAAGIWCVSQATRVEVAGVGTRRFAWFPSVGAALLLVALTAASALALARTRRPVAVEGFFVTFVVGPAALLLALGSFPGAIGPADPFHEGEWLAAAHLTQQGAFPWRDLLFVHGFLPDVVLGLVSFHLFGDTRWAYLAARSLLFDPLFWVALYVLVAYLCRRRRGFLFLAMAGLVLGSMPMLWAVHDRFVAYPFELLLFAALLRRPTPLLVVPFSLLVCLHAVVAPESIESAVAMLVVLVGFELHHRNGRPLRRALPRTEWALGTAVVCAATLAAFLAAHHALDDLVLYYRTFGSGYDLVTGIPVQWGGPTGPHFAVAVILPVVLWLATFALFAWKLWARRAFATDEWVAGAVGLFLLVYYPKFLGRADGHIYQVFAVAIPLLFFWALRVFTAGEAVLARLRERHKRLPAPQVATSLVLVAVAVAAPGSVGVTLRGLPTKFRGAAPSPTPGAPARLGFANETDVDVPALRDLRTIIDAYAGSDGPVADLTNSPAFFYYLLDRRPGSRYYHVSMAFKRRNQRDMIRALERSRPPLVVYSKLGGPGLVAWDGIPNTVRSYDVSEWVLRHYVPLALTHEYLLFARRDVAARTPFAQVERQLLQPATTSNLYFGTYSCDWGDAPNFLSTGPAPGRRPVNVPIRPAGTLVRVSGWAISGDSKRPADDVVVARGDRIVAAATPTVDRADVAAALGSTEAQGSGFSVAAQLPPGATARMVDVYAVTGGRAWLLDGASRETAHDLPSRLRSVSGRTIRVAGRGGHGFVDAVSSDQLAALELPRAADRYSWLRLTSPSALAETRIELTDRPGSDGHSIALTTLPSARTSVLVQVGACAQWYGYGRRLLLTTHGATAFRSAALYRP